MLGGVFMVIVMVLVIPVGVMLGGALWSAALSFLFPASPELTEPGGADE
jgi:hypothetical protein